MSGQGGGLEAGAEEGKSGGRGGSGVGRSPVRLQRERGQASHLIGHRRLLGKPLKDLAVSVLL
jgi:hypothetical protein